MSATDDGIWRPMTQRTSPVASPVPGDDVSRVLQFAGGCCQCAMPGARAVLRSVGIATPGT